MFGYILTAKPFVSTIERIMDQKAILKRAYKENPPLPGIYRITNKGNGKILIGSGMDVGGRMNSQRAQLRMGSHRNVELQEDWVRFGADQFVFEVIDYLTPSTEPLQDTKRDLEALEGLWIARLKPFGERGYKAREE